MASPGIDPRLVGFMVIGITTVFLITAISAVIRNQTVDAGWFLLMGGIAGGVLSYGVVKKK